MLKGVVELSKLQLVMNDLLVFLFSLLFCYLYANGHPLQEISCTSVCPNEEACCKLASGEYGCCTEGYLCDESTGMCRKLSSKDLLTRRKPEFVAPVAIKMPPYHSFKNIICPDGKAECLDNQTCCKISASSSGKQQLYDEYGCCPAPNAVCCSDGKHCCLEGQTCDIKDGTCTGFSHTSKSYFFIKRPQSSLGKFPTEKVHCPNSSIDCPVDNTCCMRTTGTYGCCPIPNATCCSNEENCCPAGYKCGSNGDCIRSTSVIPLLKGSIVKKIICPDGISMCPDGSTCCEVSPNVYDCCPSVDAVCCSDHKHCCSKGYVCNIADGTCSKPDLDSVALPALKKQPSTRYVQNVACPDSTKRYCPFGSICCKLSSGLQYKCCRNENGCDGGICSEAGFIETPMSTRKLAKTP